MTAIATYRGLVAVGHAVLCVQDAGRPYGDDADGEDARVATMRTVVAATAHQLFVRVAQTTVAVAIQVDVHDAAPAGALDAVGAAGWGGLFEASIGCASGRLRIENTTSGPVTLLPGDLTEIPVVAAGAVRVRVSARGREETARQASEVFRSHPDAGVEERHALLAALDGGEAYLVEIWPV